GSARSFLPERHQRRIHDGHAEHDGHPENIFGMRYRAGDGGEDSMNCASNRTATAMRRTTGPLAAFTLLEVMIALAIFFMAIFAILGTVNRGLGAARSLQQKFPDLGMALSDLALTNRLEEGTVTGDFGDAYPGYTWIREQREIATNGLFQLDITIQG